jgi:hypothetical protein
MSDRRNKAAGSSRARTIGIVVVALLVIAVTAVGIIFYAPAFTSQPLPSVTPAPTPELAPAATMPPTPAATASPVLVPDTPEVTPTAGPVSAIPPTGVWVHVVYDGSFSGTAGAPGRFREISGSGNQFFQIPARDEIISASITKQDSSANPLTVEFYREGVMVKTKTITRPLGTLDLDVDLKSANNVAPLAAAP